jgi:dCMP deaminase
MKARPAINDKEWLARCAAKGRESPDPRTKVGCVLVDSEENLLCEACNTYPTGVVEAIQERTEAPLKYIWIEHAERNAIYLAARRGVPTERAKMIVELTPCVECTRAIIQAGVAQLVINYDRSAEYVSDRYSREHSTALAMLAEAGVAVRFVSPRLGPREGEDA